MLSLFASWLADTSLRASVAIVLLLCLRPALRRWIGSRALAWLWLAIVARLLFPLPVSAPWQVPSLFSAPASAAASPYHFRVSVAPAGIPAALGITASSLRASPPRTHSGPAIFALLWISGALLAAVRLANGWWITRRWSARTLPADALPGLPSTYLALPVGLRRGVGLRLTDDLDVPTLVGVFRPQIWLPRALPDTLNSVELRHVLLHELGHARRHDLLAQWLCSLACCLHWFNPLVWFLARLARTDRELACDAWVLSRHTQESETAASYGHTLLKVVSGLFRVTPHTLPVVSMAAGKRHLDLRLREICAFRPPTRWRGVSALAATLALVVFCTLRNAVAGPETEPTASPSPTAASSPSSSLSTPAGSPPAFPVPPPHASASPARPLQVEIESKFIEVAKSSALALEKAGPPSSPVARVFHQIFARFGAQASPDAPTIFRSAPVLPDDFQLLVRQLNQEKGVDLLSAPRVTMKSGQKGTVEIIREFIYPTAFQKNKGPFDKPVTTPTNFDKKNTGVTLEVNPTIEPDGKVIDLSLTWTITNFDGFVDADGKPVKTSEKGMPEKMPGATFPVFDSRSVSTVATLPSGATVVFSRDEDHLFTHKSLRFAKGDAEDNARPAKDDQRVVLVFITATLVDPLGAVPTGTDGLENHVSATDAPGIYKSDQPLSQPTGSPASLPYGVPVQGKPGFVTSPYAPDAGYVDLRGFTRDQSVRDPYTSKMFLVP